MNRVLNKKENIYQLLPLSLQNLLITLYNIKSYRERYGGKYSYFRRIFKANNNLTLAELQNIQKERFDTFLTNAIKNSEFYTNLYNGHLNTNKLSNIKELPVVNKEIFRNHLKELYTIEKSKGIVSKTWRHHRKVLRSTFYT